MRTSQEVKDELKSQLIRDMGLSSYDSIPEWAWELADTLIMEGWRKK